MWIGPSSVACDLLIGSRCKLLVNELLETTCGATTYQATLQTGGAGYVQIVNSTGVRWTFTQVQ